MSGLPKLGDTSPIDYKCNREIGAVFGEAFCGEPAVLHIAWDAAMENSIACHKHATEALTDYEPYDWHTLDHNCTVGKTWFRSGTPGDSFCGDDNIHPDLVELASAPIDVTP